MKYMGSKARFKKRILDAMGQIGSVYVEPFAGGMNMIDCVKADRRIANDANKYVIAMFKAVVNGWVPPEISRHEYAELKNLNGSDEMIGWAGIGCSYSGKWFGGYAGICQTRGGERNYQREALRSIINQARLLRGVEFSSLSYSDLEIPDHATVYCDPPYQGTTGYGVDFDHVAFWDWVRKISKRCRVFVSEYTAPDDFECILEINAKSSLSANGRSGGNKNSTEKLFVIK
ncbi:hypothetical protein [Klebsiella phage vB_KvaS_F1M1D]|nr:hypothetical protein [Klebsiella phage vB_KvaS_F1M1D]